MFNHIVRLSSSPDLPRPTLDDIIQRTWKTYNGPLKMGEDLMSIEIGDSVKVSNYPGPRSKPTEIIK